MRSTCGKPALISVMAEAVRQKDADDEQVPMLVKTDGKLLEESKQRSIDVVAGTQSLMVIVILALACVVAFASRLFAVIRFESIIHEFDPWYGDGGVRWEGRAGIDTANLVAVLVESSMVQVQLSCHTPYGDERVLSLPELVRQTSVVSFGTHCWRDGKSPSFGGREGGREGG